MSIPEIGSEWVGDSLLGGEITTRVVHVTSFGSRMWVTHERDTGVTRSVVTLTLDSFERSFNPKPTFFQIDKTYRMRDGAISYTIKELHLVDSPSHENQRHVAIALASSRNGNWIEVLNIADFKLMEEVK